jgi:O-methyltransferase
MNEMLPNAPFALTEDMENLIADLFFPDDKDIESLKLHTLKMPEKKMKITDVQGHFLSFLIKIFSIKNIIEIGTYTGTSTLYMAKALPIDGQITSLDKNPEWTRIARNFWEKGEVSHKINLMLGDALPSLDTLPDNKFDFVFIDADKKNYEAYFEKSLKKLVKNGHFIIDNICLNGKLALESDDKLVKKLIKFYSSLKNDTRITITFLPIHDGMLWGRKL